MAYIGLDIGTSSCKASIINRDAKIIATAQAEYGFKFPQRGFVELDPTEIYGKVKQVLKELAPLAVNVTAISISSFGEAFVLLDKNDSPLYNFITYADSRSEGIDQMLIEKYTAEKFYDITAAVPNQTFSICKLIWLQKHHPEILEKAKSIYLANDYYNYLLTGNRGVDYGTASKTLLFDVYKSDWSDIILNEFDIPREWFSPVYEVGTSLGKIRTELAEELGLANDIILYLGTHDQCSATLGGGANTPGSAVIGEGSTESINLVVDDSVFDNKAELIKLRICAEPFLVKGLYILQSSFLTYGNAIRWYLKTFEGDTKEKLDENQDIYSYLESQSLNETELIFLPHLSKVNLMDPDNTIPGSFIGITLDTEKWEFYRALMQGLTFESKINLDILKNIGVPITYISATGGITNSPLFMQFKADVLEKEINILENSEAGIMGLAIICAIAEGDYDNHEEAIDKFVKSKNVYSPKNNYNELFEKYMATRNLL